MLGLSWYAILRQLKKQPSILQTSIKANHSLTFIVKTCSWSCTITWASKPASDGWSIRIHGTHSSLPYILVAFPFQDTISIVFEVTICWWKLNRFHHTAVVQYQHSNMKDISLPLRSSFPPPLMQIPLTSCPEFHISNSQLNSLVNKLYVPHGRPRTEILWKGGLPLASES